MPAATTVRSASCRWRWPTACWHRQPAASAWPRYASGHSSLLPDVCAMQCTRWHCLCRLLSGAACPPGAATLHPGGSSGGLPRRRRHACTLHPKAGVAVSVQASWTLALGPCLLPHGARIAASTISNSPCSALTCLQGWRCALLGGQPCRRPVPAGEWLRCAGLCWPLLGSRLLADLLLFTKISV